MVLAAFLISATQQHIFLKPHQNCCGDLKPTFFSDHTPGTCEDISDYMQGRETTWSCTARRLRRHLFRPHARWMPREIENSRLRKQLRLSYNTLTRLSLNWSTIRSARNESQASLLLQDSSYRLWCGEAGKGTKEEEYQGVQYPKDNVRCAQHFYITCKTSTTETNSVEDETITKTDRPRPR
jgi:hypothetical protein